MLIDRLFNQTDAPLLEKVLKFTAARQEMLADNMANVSTPGYRQKDLSPAEFEKMLSRRMEEKENAPRGSVGFDDIEVDVSESPGNLLFHDGNNRSMEQLAADMAKNGLYHNMVVELLRKQFQTMEMALKDKL